MSQMSEMDPVISMISQAAAQAASQAAAQAAQAIQPKANPRLNEGIKFFGVASENPRQWLNWLDNYFLFNNTDGNKRTQYAILLLQGVALTWACNHPLLRTLSEVVYENFKTLFLERFSPVDAAHQARVALHNLKQDGPVQTYINKFLDLMSFLDGMDEREQLFIFQSGLNQTLRMECARSNVQNVQQAMNLVVRIEETLRTIAPSNHTHLSTNPMSQSSLYYPPRPHQPSSLSSHVYPSFPSSSSLSSSLSSENGMDIEPSIRAVDRMYTAADVELLLARQQRERRGNVRCYKCNKLGHYQNECWSNNSRKSYSKNGQGQRRN